MKRIFLLIFLTLTCMAAYSADYGTMKFTTISGEESYVSLNNLEIKFTDGMMHATSSTGNINIPLSELQFMEFSENGAGVISIQLDPDSPVDVYSLEGKSFGTYSSFREAKGCLENGVYLFVQKNGSTVKIAIEK